MCYGSSYFAAFSTLIKPHVSSINVGPVLVYYPEGVHDVLQSCDHPLSAHSAVLAHLGQLYELLLAVPSVGRHDGRAVEGDLLPRQVQVAVTLHMALPAHGGAAGGAAAL